MPAHCPPGTAGTAAAADLPVLIMHTGLRHLVLCIGAALHRAHKMPPAPSSASPAQTVLEAPNPKGLLLLRSIFPAHSPKQVATEVGPKLNNLPCHESGGRCRRFSNCRALPAPRQQRVSAFIPRAASYVRDAWPESTAHSSIPH